MRSSVQNDPQKNQLHFSREELARLEKGLANRSQVFAPSRPKVRTDHVEEDGRRTKKQQVVDDLVDRLPMGPGPEQPGEPAPETLPPADPLQPRITPDPLTDPAPGEAEESEAETRITDRLKDISQEVPLEDGEDGEADDTVEIAAEEVQQAIVQAGLSLDTIPDQKSKAGETEPEVADAPADSSSPAPRAADGSGDAGTSRPARLQTADGMPRWTGPGAVTTKHAAEEPPAQEPPPEEVIEEPVAATREDSSVAEWAKDPDEDLAEEPQGSPEELKAAPATEVMEQLPQDMLEEISPDEEDLKEAPEAEVVEQLSPDMLEEIPPDEEDLAEEDLEQIPDEALEEISDEEELARLSPLADKFSPFEKASTRTHQDMRIGLKAWADDDAARQTAPSGMETPAVQPPAGTPVVQPAAPVDTAQPEIVRRLKGGQAAPATGVEALPASSVKEAPARKKPWYLEIFDEDWLRTLPKCPPEQLKQETAFIEQSLNVPQESRLLEMGCGAGLHSMSMGQRGFQLTSVDMSLPLLLNAARLTQRKGLRVDYLQGDHRSLGYEEQFDGAFCMGNRFGYFDEVSNQRVLEAVCRALRTGGRFLLEVLNRDYAIKGLPTRIWWEGEGCVILEEVNFEYFTSRLLNVRTIVFEDGRSLEQEISIRVYSLHEIGKLLHRTGFKVREVSGHIACRGEVFDSHSRSLLLLAEKRAVTA